MVKLVKWSFNNAAWHLTEAEAKTDPDKGPHYVLYIGPLEFGWTAKGFFIVSASVRYGAFYRGLQLFGKTLTGWHGPYYARETGNPARNFHACAYLGKLIIQVGRSQFARHYDRFYRHLADYAEVVSL